jgi:hypothetical protein
LQARRILLTAACIAAAAPAALAAAAGAQQQEPPQPDDPVTDRGDLYRPKPAGTNEDLRFFYGPYHIPPGHDMNRFDLNLPVREGFVLSIDPSLRNALDMTEPVHQEAHIHHAHWLRVKPGHREDNHTYGFTQWLWGMGDEETKADARPVSAADPNGPVYGGYTRAGFVEPVVYMIHNKTSRPLNVYIVLSINFLHGSPAELERQTGRPHRHPQGVIFGRTYHVPRDAAGDGRHETARDDARGPIEWTSTMDGTIAALGGHLHPGGIEVQIENLGSEERPCARAGGAYGGTLLFRSEAVSRRGMFSEDFQMTISRPAWRAPIRKGDRIRVNGVYENRDYAWYDVMAHTGLFIDPEIPPRAGCEPYLLGQPKPRLRRLKRRRGESRRHFRVRLRRERARYRRARRRYPNPTTGVLNREWSGQTEHICGEQFGAGPCERPEPDRGPGIATSTVTIEGFTYTPGDRNLSGSQGAPVRVRSGSSLTFVNADQQAGIRHTVTTCRWPCNGTYTANYPWADGTWDSGILGRDLVEGGSVSPVASTPRDLPAGRYSYFCRIHPWMRGAFEVAE